MLKIELVKLSRSFEGARQRAEDVIELLSQYKPARLSKIHIFIALILDERDTRDSEFVFTWSPEGLITRAEYVEQKADNLDYEDDDDDGE